MIINKHTGTSLDPYTPLKPKKEEEKKEINNRILLATESIESLWLQMFNQL